MIRFGGPVFMDTSKGVGEGNLEIATNLRDLNRVTRPIPSMQNVAIQAPGEFLKPFRWPGSKKPTELLLLFLIFYPGICR